MNRPSRQKSAAQAPEKAPAAPRRARATTDVQHPPPAAPRRGRPAGDREAKRAELLKAAVAVIAEEGYSATSLRKVAERAGCTTGAVTYYFANKEEMVTALVQGLFDEFDRLLEENRDAVDVKAILRQSMDRNPSHDPEFWLVMFQFLAQARHEPAYVELVRERYARFRHAFTKLLEKGQREGTIRTDIAADLLADQISAISDGWMLMYPIEPDRFEPKRRKALLEALGKLIAPPAGVGRSR